MKITNINKLPQQFIDFVKKDYEYKDKRYSVTTVLKGTKEILLQRRHNNEIEQDISDMIFLIFGTAAHMVLEQSNEAKDELKETKIEVQMPNGYTLSGQQDLYSESLRRVTDFKTGTVYKVIYNDWDDYRKQLLIYAYMFRTLGLPCDNGEIIMMLKDHSKSKAKIDSSYPQLPTYVKHFDFTEEEFKQIEQDLIYKFEQIEMCEKLTDDEISECTPEQRWAEPTKYALMKKGRKTAIKLYDNKFDADTACDSDDLYVEERLGTDKKCTQYCTCCQFCNYYKEHYGGK